jgi:AP-5 complex subunit beta-1
VIGEPLVNMVKDGGIICNIIWKDSASDSFLESTTSVTGLERGPLHLTYGEDDESGSSINTSKRNMGCFLVLIFLPPRFHLLLQMEVSDLSTLVRIRTDCWPCLAYVDDYLEGLFLA